MLPIAAILPVEAFAACTAVIELSRPSFVGDEEVGTMIKARFEESEVRFVWEDGPA